jgi:phage-related protein
MANKEKPLEWVGSSHKDLKALPVDVRRFFGYALSLAQAGDQHDAAKVLKGFSGAGVLEVVEDDAGATYRAVYTVKFDAAVFVLHCFQKKSKRGIATPKADMDIIRARLKPRSGSWTRPSVRLPSWLARRDEAAGPALQRRATTPGGSAGAQSGA